MTETCKSLDYIPIWRDHISQPNIDSLENTESPLKFLFSLLNDNNGPQKT